MRSGAWRPGAGSAGEARKPGCVRINQQRVGSKGDAIGNAGVTAMQAHRPGFRQDKCEHARQSLQRLSCIQPARENTNIGQASCGQAGPRWGKKRKPPAKGQAASWPAEIRLAALGGPPAAAVLHLGDDRAEGRADLRAKGAGGGDDGNGNQGGDQAILDGRRTGLVPD
jgi:hypothetical protein